MRACRRAPASRLVLLLLLLLPPQSRLKVRVVTSRAYHALFMHNMLIRPTADELANFGEPGE